MLVLIPDVLAPADAKRLRQELEAVDWVDGNVTSGQVAAKAKRNLQTPERDPRVAPMRDAVVAALNHNPTFFSAALPREVYPPMFNRYEAGMGFAAHVDNAVRFTPAGLKVRADVSCTLFLSDPDDYDGGELVIEDTYGEHRVKGEAGDLVVYPSGSLHRVEPITRGARWASFFWLQSMIRDEGQRRLLFDLDRAIQETRTVVADDQHAVVSLTATYHNLLRMWAEV